MNSKSKKMCLGAWLSFSETVKGSGYFTTNSLILFMSPFLIDKAKNTLTLTHHRIVSSPVFYHNFYEDLPSFVLSMSMNMFLNCRRTFLVGFLHDLN